MNLSILPMALLALLMLTSTTANEYPSDYHLYSNLSSFRAPVLQSITGNSYRLVWHAWHQKPATILANCNKSICYLELRYTDGYGTYYQGKLQESLKKNISVNEFERIATGFAENGFSSLSPQLRENSAYEGIKYEITEEEKDDKMETVTFCLHAPHYYLESNIDDRYHLIYRYCQPNYTDDLKSAFPLIELAEKTFPKQMEDISAYWIKELEYENSPNETNSEGGDS